MYIGRIIQTFEHHVIVGVKAILAQVSIDAIDHSGPRLRLKPDAPIEYLFPRAGDAGNASDVIEMPEEFVQRLYKRNTA